MSLSERPFSPSLGNHLLGIYLGSLVFLLVTLLFFQIFCEYRAFDRNIRTTGHLITESLRASMVNPTLRTLAYDRLDDILNTVYTENKDVHSIRVYEVPEHLAAAVGAMSSRENDDVLEVMEMLLQENRKTLVQHHGEQHIFWRLLKVDAEIIGVFRLSVSLAYYKKQLFQSVLFFLGIAILLATISSWLFTEYLKRRVINPLSATSEVMEGFQQADLEQYLKKIDAVIRTLPDNEIGRMAKAYEKAVQMIQQYNRERERIVTAVEQASDSIVITDSHGTIQYVNPAFEAHSGYSAAEALGNNPRILQSGDHDEAFFQDMWRTLSSGKRWKGKLTNRRKDGSLYREESSISPIIGSGCEITNYVAVKRDCSKEETLEQQLNQAQRMESIGRLAGGIAHDFNNILTVIHGQAQLSLFQMASDEPLRKEIEVIQEAAAKATSLVRRLLAFSSQQIVCHESINFRDEILAIKKVLERLLGEDVKLTLLLDENLWPVVADRGQFEQIVMNLVGNSCDAMPNGGTVTIEASNLNLAPGSSLEHSQDAVGEHVLLRITDTGNGMSSETQELVFEPFYTTKEIGKGTGLGLSTVYGLVKQHNGWITVESEPEIGTSFSMYFPRCGEKGDARKDARTEEYAGTPETGTATILLVEDDVEVRKVLVQFLTDRGYTVLEAVDGVEALRVSGQFHDTIHLLLTDVVMPNMHGPQLAELLKEERPDVKVIFMSGYTEETIIRYGVLKNEVDFLQKPIGLMTLATRIHNML